MIESHNFETRDAGMGWMINHLPAIVWQRRYYAITVFLAFLIVSTAAAFALPTLYRSTATLLIESQELPTDVAESPGTGAIEQRIAKIRERVLSRGDLITLIEQYDLYSSERRSQPLSKVIDKMRKATAVGALEGDIGSQPSGNPNQSNVIALNMTYDYADPVKSQEVLQSFVQSFLRMDSDVVENQAMLTVRFLQDQAEKLASQIQQIESEITALKSRNGSALVQGGMPSMIDTGSYSAQIVDLENQNRQLLLQSRSGGKNNAIAAAEAALTAARSQFSDTHPDVVAARERLRVLQQQAAQAGPSATNDGIQEQISANNQAIGLLRAQRDTALARANASVAGQARAPAILEQASQLEDRATQLRDQYKKVSDDLLKAQNSARMAGEQRAERLSLVEPANLPDHPHWPNRPLLIGAGAAAGLVFGLLLALVMELLQRPVRSPVQIEGLGIPVVGIVPIIDRGLKKRRWWPFARRQEAGLA